MKSRENHITKKFLKVILPCFIIFYSAFQLSATPISKPIKNKIIFIEDATLILEITPKNIICIENTIDVKMKVSGVDTNYPVQVLLYNTIGNLVYRMDLSLDKTNIHFQFKPQTKITEGLYFVSVLNGNNRVTRRMVVNTQN